MCLPEQRAGVKLARMETSFVWQIRRSLLWPWIASLTSAEAWHGKSGIYMQMSRRWKTWKYSMWVIEAKLAQVHRIKRWLFSSSAQITSGQLQVGSIPMILTKCHRFAHISIWEPLFQVFKSDHLHAKKHYLYLLQSEFHASAQRAGKLIFEAFDKKKWAFNFNKFRIYINIQSCKKYK